MDDFSAVPIQDLGDDDDAYITAQPDRSVVLTLRYPVSLTLKRADGAAEDLVSTVTFRRLTGGQIMEASSRQGAKATSYLLSASSGQPAVLWAKLDGEDFRRATEVIAGFTGRSRPTGP